MIYLSTSFLGCPSSCKWVIVHASALLIFLSRYHAVRCQHHDLDLLVQVWSLSIDVHVLDNGGNLADACMLCTLAALMAFRRPDTEVVAGGADSARARVTLLSPSVREPVPLSLHHLPLAISFAFFEVWHTRHGSLSLLSIAWQH